MLGGLGPCAECAWVAVGRGFGPDATPYFRVFNPDTQAKKFDDGGAYRNAWIAEGQRNAPKTALIFMTQSHRRGICALTCAIPIRLLICPQGATVP